MNLERMLSQCRPVVYAGDGITATIGWNGKAWLVVVTDQDTGLEVGRTAYASRDRAVALAEAAVGLSCPGEKGV